MNNVNSINTRVNEAIKPSLAQVLSILNVMSYCQFQMTPTERSAIQHQLQMLMQQQAQAQIQYQQQLAVQQAQIKQVMSHTLPPLESTKKAMILIDKEVTNTKSSPIVITDDAPIGDIRLTNPVPSNNVNIINVKQDGANSTIHQNQNNSRNDIITIPDPSDDR